MAYAARNHDIHDDPNNSLRAVYFPPLFAIYSSCDVVTVETTT